MRGTALVEAAFVLQILLMITLGAIEYGWLFLIQQRITTDAHMGDLHVLSVKPAMSGRLQAHRVRTGI